MREYIDIRGPWPVYHNGMIAIELRGDPNTFRLQYPKLPKMVNFLTVGEFLRRHQENNH